jgi:hypothetical protein
VASILIADDETRISAFIDKGLRAAGFATRVTGSGSEALDLALSGEFDLVVLDVNLPGMTGFQVLEGADLGRLRGELVDPVDPVDGGMPHAYDALHLSSLQGPARSRPYMRPCITGPSGRVTAFMSTTGEGCRRVRRQDGAGERARQVRALAFLGLVSGPVSADLAPFSAA